MFHLLYKMPKLFFPGKVFFCFNIVYADCRYLMVDLRGYINFVSLISVERKAYEALVSLQYFVRGFTYIGSQGRTFSSFLFFLAKFCGDCSTANCVGP
jgi:hypothetical protein